MHVVSLEDARRRDDVARRSGIQHELAAKVDSLSGVPDRIATIAFAQFVAEARRAYEQDPGVERADLMVLASFCIARVEQLDRESAR